MTKRSRKGGGAVYAVHVGQAAEVVSSAELKLQGGLLLPQREQGCYGLPGHLDRAAAPFDLGVFSAIACLPFCGNAPSRWP